MREQCLESLTSALSDVFLEIRSQSMISFHIKGISGYLFHDMNVTEHLHQWLRDAVTERFPLGLKYLSFIKYFLNLKIFPYCNFVKFNHIMLKRIVYISLFALLALPLAAQDNMQKVTLVDSLYEFSFVAGKDMFYIPYGDNRAELERLKALIRQNYEGIADSSIHVYVDGYCNSMSGKTENKAVARTRSNRVKSELIEHERLKEAWFITRNHVAKGDRVTVRIRISVHPEITMEEGNTGLSKNDRIQVVSEPVRDIVTEPDGNETVQDEQAISNVMDINLVEKGKSNYSIALRANLLRWVTLTPDLGIEWRVNRHVGILVDGSWTSWSWESKNHCYAIWEVSPEVRYYIDKEKRGFLGAMYHIGEFNYKLEDTGKQGNYQGGGITGGYMLPLNRSLALDFHATMGYTRAEYDKYKVTDGVRVRQGSTDKNYWGINQLGVKLVWKFNQ